MIIELNIENIFDFLKNNPGVNITTFPIRDITRKYLFENVYQDQDFEYLPKKYILSLLLEFLIYTELELDFNLRNTSLIIDRRLPNTWFKKVDNLFSLVKSNQIEINIASHIIDSVEKLYDITEYPPFLELIIEGYRNYSTRTKKDHRERLTKNNPEMFKKLVVLGLFPPPYSKKEEQLYKQATHNAIVDMSIGLRGSGLPSLVLENIAKQAYYPADMNVGMNVYQLVKNITEHKTSGQQN